MRFHDVKQGTDEWFNLRLGLITSSNFAKIMANYGKAFGNPAIEYARKVALERITGVKEESFQNDVMRRGNELEPIAIQEYEKEKMVDVKSGGFYSYLTYGDSPDGRVCEKGCNEVKCPYSTAHWERLEKGGYDLKYKWQIQGHIWQGQKDWCDFISFNPDFPPNKRLYIFRVMRDEEMIEKMVERLADFEKLVQEKVKILS